MPQDTGTSLLYSQPLFDTTVIPAGLAGAVVSQFFVIPWSQPLVAGVPKTYRHTNMIQAGRLEEGNEMQIEAISLYFPRTAEAGAYPTIADMDAIRAGNFRLRFGGNSDYLILPIAAIPNGGWSPTYSTDAALAAEVNFTFNNGVSVTQNKLPLPQPIKLRSQETVGVTFENMDGIVAPTEVIFCLWGPAIRPVR